jgi:uncharacterized RDD family membrane protein YckC
MDNVPEANRFAPPVAHVEDIASADGGALAGRGSRLLAIIVDGILGALVFWAISLLTPFNVFRPDLSLGLPMLFVESLVVGFAIFLLLNGYLLHTRGQTIGKMLLKIRIVRSDGSKASLLRLAGLRYLVNNMLTLIPMVGWLYGLLDALLIFRASHKCLHDNIADTIVVKA